MQTGVEGDVEYYEAEEDATVVKIFQFEAAASYKRLGRTTVMRYFTSDQHIPRARLASGIRAGSALAPLSIADLMGALEAERQRKPRAILARANARVVWSLKSEVKRRLAAGPEQAAASYIASLVDALRQHHESVDYIEGFNELISSSDREMNKLVVEFETSFAYQIAALGLRTRACVLNVAVGNPHIDWVVDLLPAVRAAVETGGCVGYHAYWWANQTTDGLLSWFEWHAGRWIEWRKVFQAHGLNPNFILTECGVVASSDGYALNAHAGWKHRDCLNGDIDRYVAQITTFENLIGQIPECVGFVLFTAGGQPYTNWENFQVDIPLMDRLAARA